MKIDEDWWRLMSLTMTRSSRLYGLKSSSPQRATLCTDLHFSISIYLFIYSYFYPDRGISVFISSISRRYQRHQTAIRASANLIIRSVFLLCSLAQVSLVRWCHLTCLTIKDLKKDQPQHLQRASQERVASYRIVWSVCHVAISHTLPRW